MKRRKLARIILQKLTKERDQYFNKLSMIEKIGEENGWNDDEGILPTIKEIIYSQDIDLDEIIKKYYQV